MGKFVLVRAGDLGRDEWTTIGVVCFNDKGKQTDSRFDTRRAVRRGDLPDPSENEFLHEYLKDYAQSIPSLDVVNERRATEGHAMSMIQMTEPRPYVGPDTEGVLYEHFLPEP